MNASTRQYYGSIALLLIFIAGVFGGVSWLVPSIVDNLFALWFWGLVVAGVLFGWVATRDSGAKKAPK